MAKNYKIAVIGGDGTGPEVIAEGMKVLNSAAQNIISNSITCILI